MGLNESNRLITKEFSFILVVYFLTEKLI